ncbi:MAG: hypothetical protein IJX99_01465 [Clostridia bacterium]|nr:hypothetical protein [Clostridia bacterium]
MNNAKLSAVIKNRRTTNGRLSEIYFSYPELPVESIAMMARHPRIEADLLDDILDNDGQCFEVALAVATRTNILTFTPLRKLACIIRDNTHNWSRDELERVFEEFKKNIPDGNEFAPYLNWRNLTLEQVCDALDDDDEDDACYDCTGDEDDYDEFWNDDEDGDSFDEDDDFARGDYEYDPDTDSYYDKDGNELDYVEGALADAWDDAMEK